MLLGSSAFATQIRADIAPLRVVLLTLFFSAAGMVADPIWIFENWNIVAAVCALVTIGKLLIIWMIFLMLGQTSRVSSATGLCLAQVGEFAFVLGAIGRTSGVVSADLYALVVSVTIVSFILSAFLVPIAPRFGNAVARLFRDNTERAESEGDVEAAPEVVIIGFGPAGQIAARPLIDKGIQVAVIDLNRDGIRKAQQLGFKGEIGDATQNEVLEHIRLHECQAVVITVPHHNSSMSILEQVRKDAPHVHVIVRSRYHMHTDEYLAAGAHAVTGDEERVGESLADHISQWLSARELSHDGALSKER
jgi:CPA2 family monovalent cation:H+ antiporter-2